MQENITFENRQAQVLSGVLHTPANGQTRACALFAHCFTCTKNSKAAVRISEALAAEGVEVLRFDFTGLGQSEGDFSSTDFSSNVDDLVDAAAFMGSRGAAPSLLIGHSLGGTAVLAAAHEIDSALAVATIGAPADASHVLHLLDEDLPEIQSKGRATVRLAGRPFNIKQDFVEDVRTQSVCENLRSLRKALLVMHSPIDEVVPIDQARLIYKNALHPKSYVSLDDADHLLTRDRDSRYAARLLATWASRYVGVEDQQPKKARHVPGSATVLGDIEDGFLVSINADGHMLLGDEPAGKGGTGLGPTPYDLLGAALASCTVMTLNFFARRENLPLEVAEVSVKHDRIHAEDCESCDKKSGKVDRLSREITLRGNLDDEQRALLMKIADRCPVHRSLENEITIANRLR
jgi:putative redox protein